MHAPSFHALHGKASPRRIAQAFDRDYPGHRRIKGSSKAISARRVRRALNHITKTEA